MRSAGQRRVAASAVLALALTLAPSTHAAVRPPRLDYTMTTLDNGLKVVFLEDHSTPIVHLQIWYHVGSKNERPGRTGFAHFFEHMMFKGSKNVEPEGHPSYVSSVGGQSNAYTNEDATVFWETVPAQYLPLVLWLEADRMASLRIDESAFRNEREVVKEERRMRVDNQPYGRLNEIIYDQAFAVHPYKHATIGSMVDLEAASVEDVRDFYRTYYVPSNATIVLVGDFDAAALGLLQLEPLVDQLLLRLLLELGHHCGAALPLQLVEHVVLQLHDVFLLHRLSLLLGRHLSFPHQGVETFVDFGVLGDLRPARLGFGLELSG